MLFKIVVRMLLKSAESVKMNDHQPTRNVKDEGLFVPSHPQVKAKNVNRLRQRLVTANNG